MTRDSSRCWCAPAGGCGAPSRWWPTAPAMISAYPGMPESLAIAAHAAPSSHYFVSTVAADRGGSRCSWRSRRTPSCRRRLGAIAADPANPRPNCRDRSRALAATCPGASACPGTAFASAACACMPFPQVPITLRKCRKASLSRATIGVAASPTWTHAGGVTDWGFIFVANQVLFAHDVSLRLP
jgi:hypothetical protein